MEHQLAENTAREERQTALSILEINTARSHIQICANKLLFTTKFYQHLKLKGSRLFLAKDDERPRDNDNNLDLFAFPMISPQLSPNAAVNTHYFQPFAKAEHFQRLFNCSPLPKECSSFPSALSTYPRVHWCVLVFV